MTEEPETSAPPGPCYVLWRVAGDPHLTDISQPS